MRPNLTTYYHRSLHDFDRPHSSDATIHKTDRPGRCKKKNNLVYIVATDHKVLMSLLRTPTHLPIQASQARRQTRTKQQGRYCLYTSLLHTRRPNQHSQTTQGVGASCRTPNLHLRTLLPRIYESPSQQVYIHTEAIPGRSKGLNAVKIREASLYIGGENLNLPSDGTDRCAHEDQSFVLQHNPTLTAFISTTCQ